jgi:hypothetical protein
VRFLMIGLAFGVLLSGCTRHASESADVRLVFSSKGQGSLSSNKLTNVFVSVSGPGLNPPISYTWNRHSCDKCPAPAEIVLTVPSGQNRLVQYLGVYETDSQTIILKYGDATKTLSQATETVEITASTIGSSAIQGHVFGRYLNGAEAGGPSGSLVAQFVPPNGRPPMTVMHSQMFSGWFSLMLLDGDARLNYLLNGSPLYSAVNLNSPEFAASSRVAIVRIPAYERERNVGAWEPEGESRSIFGFFGPNASSQIACYDSRDNLAIPGALLPAPAAENLNWMGTNPSTASAGPLAGGEGFDPTGTGATCQNAPTEFVDHMVYHQDQLKNGHDSVMGAKPPFQAYGVSVSGAQMQYIEAIPDSATSSVQLNWKYLPGVTVGPMRVAGVTPFRRDGPNVISDDLYEDGGVACSRLSAMGFYQAGPDVPAASGQTVATTTLTGVANLANVKLVLCPFFDEGNGRQYWDAGLEVYSGGGFNTPALSLKIIGGNLTQSRIYGPSVSQPLTLLKAAVLNGFHNLAVAVGPDQFLTSSDIQSAEVTIDDGVTWLAIEKADATFTSVNPSVPVGLLPLNTANTLSSALGGNADIQFKIRVVATAAAASSWRLMQNSITSPAITLKGANSCPNPGVLELFDPVTSTVVPSNAMNSFNVTNGTDLTKTVYLRWSGCPSAMAVLDVVALSGTASPSECFDERDFDFDSSNPLVFRISPRDRAGQDCSFTTYSFDFKSPSNAGTEKFTLSGSGMTIKHSTVGSALRFLASVDDMTGISAEKLFVKMAMLGELNPVAWNAVKVNLDQRLTGAAAVASGGAAWNLGEGAANWQSAPSADNRFSGITASSPATSPFTLMTVTDSSLTGGVPVATAAPGRNIIAISESTLDGGSPVLVFDNGAQLALGYVPSNYGDFNGQSLKMFNMPAFTLDPNPLFAKVFVFTDPATKEPRLFVTAAYANNVKYLFGRVVGHGTNVTIDWAAGDNLTSDSVKDVMLAKSGNVVFPFIISNYGGNNVHWGVFPIHNGTAWTSGNGGNGTSMFYQGSSGISNSLTDGGLLGLARCGSLYYVVGRNSGSYLTTQELSLTPGTLPTATSSSHSASGATRVACIGMTGASGAHGRIFVTYNESDNSNALHSFEGGTPFCGGSPNQPLSGLSALALSPSSGGFRSIVGVDGLNGLLVAYQASGYPTKLSFVDLDCTSLSVTAGAYANWGSLATPASQIQGIELLSDSAGDNASVSLGVFGDKSTFYWLKTE